MTREDREIVGPINDKRMAMGLPLFQLDDVAGAQAWMREIEQKETDVDKTEVDTDLDNNIQAEKKPDGEHDVYDKTKVKEEEPTATVAPPASAVKSSAHESQLIKELEEAKTEIARLKSGDGRAKKLADEKKELEEKLAAEKKRADEAVLLAKKASAGNPLAGLTAEQLDIIDKPTAEIVLSKAQELAEEMFEQKLKELSGVSNKTELMELINAEKARNDARDAEIMNQRQNEMNRAIAKDIPREVYAYISEHPDRWAEFCNSRFGSTTEGNLYQGALNSADSGAAISQLRKFARLNDIELPDPKKKQPLKPTTKSGTQIQSQHVDDTVSYEQAEEYMRCSRQRRVPSFLKSAAEMDAWLTKAIEASRKGKLIDRNGKARQMPY